MTPTKNAITTKGKSVIRVIHSALPSYFHYELEPRQASVADIAFPFGLFVGNVWRWPRPSSAAATQGDI